MRDDGGRGVTRFDRYVLGQLTLLFGFFTLVLVSVYWVNRAVLLFDQLIADGQSAGTFLTFTLLALPNIIRLVLPIAAFAAAVYVTNRLTNESELVVAQAVGLSPFRLARPVLIFGLMAAALMALLVHVLVPSSRVAIADRETEIEANIAARMLTEGRFLHPAPGITFYIREITARSELRDIFLSDARDQQQRTTYMASRAYLVREASGPKLVMFDGSAQTYSPENARLQITSFETFAYDVGALMDGGGRTRRDVRSFSTPTLFAPTPEDLEAARREPAAFLYEGHLRVVQPFSPLIAALIGFAALQLGGFSRFGVWRQIALAVGLIIVVQIAENATADMARRDAALWPLVYLPSALGLAMVGTMLWRAASPPLGARARLRRLGAQAAEVPETPA